MLLGGWCWSVSFDSVDILCWHRLVDRVGGLAVIETRLAKKD
jgi:hypothetical protein